MSSIECSRRWTTFHHDLHPSGQTRRTSPARTPPLWAQPAARMGRVNDGIMVARGYARPVRHPSRGHRRDLGIGTPTAASLAEAGAQVILVARSAPKLAATRASLEAAIPGAQFTESSPTWPTCRRSERLARNSPSLARSTCSSTTQACCRPPIELRSMATNCTWGPTISAVPANRVAHEPARCVRPGPSRDCRLARSPVGTRGSVGGPLAAAEALLDAQAYGASKLANLLFAFELDRRLRERGLPIRSIAAHPGYSAIELIDKMGRWTGRVSSPLRLLSQPPELGALPTLMAATANVPGGTYFGPGRARPGAWTPTDCQSRPARARPGHRTLTVAIKRSSRGDGIPLTAHCASLINFAVEVNRVGRSRD